jgi:hypothetical protein
MVMVAAVVVVWIVLSILVGLTMAPLRRPGRVHPSSLRSLPPGSVRR